MSAPRRLARRAAEPRHGSGRRLSAVRIRRHRCPLLRLLSFRSVSVTRRAPSCTCRPGCVNAHPMGRFPAFPGACLATGKFDTRIDISRVSGILRGMPGIRMPCGCGEYEPFCATLPTAALHGARCRAADRRMNDTQGPGGAHAGLAGLQYLAGVESPPAGRGRAPRQRRQATVSRRLARAVR
jgi:hypothetical protein